MSHLLVALLLVPQIQGLPDGGRTPPSPEPPDNPAEVHEWAEDRLRDFYLSSFNRYGMVFATFMPERCDPHASFAGSLRIYDSRARRAGHERRTRAL